MYIHTHDESKQLWLLMDEFFVVHVGCLFLIELVAKLYFVNIHINKRALLYHYT